MRHEWVVSRNILAIQNKKTWWYMEIISIGSLLILAWTPQNNNFLYFVESQKPKKQLCYLSSSELFKRCHLFENMSDKYFPGDQGQIPHIIRVHRYCTIPIRTMSIPRVKQDKKTWVIFVYLAFLWCSASFSPWLHLGEGIWPRVVTLLIPSLWYKEIGLWKIIWPKLTNESHLLGFSCLF